MDIAFDMIEESDGGDTENDFEGEFTEISITLSDHSPTGGRRGLICFFRCLIVSSKFLVCIII